MELMRKPVEGGAVPGLSRVKVKDLVMNQVKLWTGERGCCDGSPHVVTAGGAKSSKGLTHEIWPKGPRSHRGGWCDECNGARKCLGSEP